MGRVDGEDLADDEPVEQHANRRQVLFGCRSGRRPLFHRPLAGLGDLQRLKVRGDMERLDIVEFADAVLLEPGEERTDGPVIGHARIVVLDRGGEETEETACRPVTGIGDHRRDDERTAERRDRWLNHRRQLAPIAAHLIGGFQPPHRTLPRIAD